MTDLERMAREAGMCVELFNMGAASIVYTGSPDCPHAGVARDELERLEALIRADERERCAKVVEMQVDRWSVSNPLLPPPYPRSYLNAAAAAIRAGRE